MPSIVVEKDPYTDEQKFNVYLVTLLLITIAFTYVLYFKTFKYINRMWKMFWLDKETKRIVKEKET
jgi:hypothetical protein